MVENDRKCPKYRASKNIKRTILWLAKNQAVFETPKEILCKDFWPFLGPHGSKECFSWGNGLFFARGLAQRGSPLLFQSQVMMVELRNQAGGYTGVTLQAPLT